MQLFFENITLEKKNGIKRVVFTLVSPVQMRRAGLCPEPTILGMNIFYTQVSHTAGIWESAYHQHAYLGVSCLIQTV